MSPAAVVALVVVVLVVLVLAAYLIALAVVLGQVSSSMRQAFAAARSGGAERESVAPALREVNAELEALAGSFERFRGDGPARR